MVRPPAPEIAPAKVVSVLIKPVVSNVPVLNTTSPPLVPPPKREPIFKLLLSCKMAPLTLLKLTTVLLPNALMCVVMTLPLVMAVLPV